MKRLPWFQALVAAAIMLGIFCRVTHLGRKQFFSDETFTALRVSGHRFSTDFLPLFDGRIHANAEILRLQRVDPTRKVTDTIEGLAIEEPQHSPLFYVLERTWASLFGSSIDALRSLPAAFALLTVPLFFWLCLELFQSVIIACVGAAMISLSPFFIDYASQAREYSMWAAMICLASTLLLRARRQKTTTAWVLYGIALVASLYTSVLTVCVLLAHAVFLIVLRPGWRMLVAFAATSCAAIAAFAPWALIGMHGQHAIDADLSWGTLQYPLLQAIEKWAFNIGAVFFDLEYANARLTIVAIALIALLGFAASDLVRSKNLSGWFILTLTAIPALALAGKDTISPGHFSLEARYLTPTWIGLALLMTAFLGTRLRNHMGFGWLTTFGIILAVEAFSSLNALRAVGWWQNNDNIPIKAIGAVITRSGPSPLVVSEKNVLLLELSHYVRPDTRFLMFDHRLKIFVPAGAFLFDPSKRVLSSFSKRYHLQVIDIPPIESALVQSFHHSLKATGAKLSALPPTEYLLEIDQRRNVGRQGARHRHAG